MKRASIRVIAISVLALTILGPGAIGIPSAEAHDEKDPRHIAMESLSKNMKTLSQALRETPPGDPEHALASEIVDVAVRMQALFETPNAGHNNNRAKPEIWSDWTGFSAKIDEFQGATAALATALKSADPAAWSSAVQAVGLSCASCHRPYRTSRR
jgi:cytochrome c556